MCSACLTTCPALVANRSSQNWLSTSNLAVVVLEAGVGMGNYWDRWDVANCCCWWWPQGGGGWAVLGRSGGCTGVPLTHSHFQ